MRIRVIQKNIADTDIRRHLDAAAAAADVDLVCFGELATTGCFYRPGPVSRLESVVKVLSRYDFAVMIGLPYRGDRGVFNAYLYHYRGHFQVYHKINLFRPMNEHLIYEPGSRLGLFETETDRVGVAICFDLRFPEVFGQLASAGASKLFVPAAFPLPRIADWKMLLQQRAVETGLPVVGINSVGGDAENVFGGSSMVVDGLGRVLAAADEASETVLTVEL